MAWIYYQSTGELRHKGKLIGTGYSGNLTNKNNPDRQHVKNMGPVVRGKIIHSSDNTPEVIR